jgi:TPP-dependent trihydroxycyclohexane-1,2-dione (THcHDO) dehydratase
MGTIIDFGNAYQNFQKTQWTMFLTITDESLHENVDDINACKKRIVVMYGKKRENLPKLRDIGDILIINRCICKMYNNDT